MFQGTRKLTSRLALAVSSLFACAHAHARSASVSLPSLTAAPKAAVSGAQVQLPQIQLGAQLPLQLPAAPALQVPSIQKAPVSQPLAAAHAGLQALTPQSAKFDGPQPVSPAVQVELQNAVYDGAKAKAQNAAPAAGSYTASPAEIPLSRLSPAWKSASVPVAGAKGLLNRKPSKNQPVDIGAEETMSAKDDIKRVSGTNPTSLSNRDAVTYYESKGFELPGAKQIGARGRTLLWIDGEGKLNAFDHADKKTNKFTAPMGEVTQYAVAEDGTLYVVAGGTIQRWDLESGDAVVLLDERLAANEQVELIAGASGLEFVNATGRFAWKDGRVYAMDAASDLRAPEPLAQLTEKAAWRATGSSAELWGAGLGAWNLAGSLPEPVESLSVSQDGSTAFALAEGKLLQWDVEGGRYRELAVPGLEDAAVAPRRVQISADGKSVVVFAGERAFVVETVKTSAAVNGPEGQVRLWSERNPMFVKDGELHIGDFRFPIATRRGKDTRSSFRKLVDRVLRRKFVAEELPLAISEKNWRALNLPSNKYNLYQTLRSFSLGQHVMYVGETGGGKTWMADMVAQITNNELWMVSLTEYTRNQDLIARDTFGEEGKNKTGLSMSVVLKWLENGGVLLLDEMHKPLEGIAALNNILQNLEYRMPDGRVIKGDPKKCFVIGTMNPVKPPYKGEPPSGELESRFGTKLRVNYLPPAEEAALLEIFKPALGSQMAKALVKIANELRRSYPDVLPLPISSRTLLHIVQEIAAYPNDDPVEIFKVKYNPMALLDDPSIGHAIDKALQAHDLRGAAKSQEGGKKKP